MKKRMNWKAWSGIAACLAIMIVTVVFISNRNTGIEEPPISTMKPVINFEGIVASVEGNSVTLQDGKVIMIDENTKFMSDPDCGRTVSQEILAGNFIQGYTEDPAEEAVVTAAKIWTNEGRPAGGGKRVINFEGRVISVENDRVTLDDGRVIRITEQTTVTSRRNVR